jgi:hypothetical protein
MNSVYSTAHFQARVHRALSSKQLKRGLDTLKAMEANRRRGPGTREKVR